MDNRISHRRPWFKSAWGLRLLHERRRLILPTMGRRRAFKSLWILRPCERPSAAHCWPLVAHLLSAGNRAQAAACVSATRSVVWVTTIACLLALWRVCCFVPHVGHRAWRSPSPVGYSTLTRAYESLAAGPTARRPMTASDSVREPRSVLRAQPEGSVRAVAPQSPCSPLSPNVGRTSQLVPSSVLRGAKTMLWKKEMRPRYDHLVHLHYGRPGDHALPRRSAPVRS